MASALRGDSKGGDSKGGQWSQIVFPTPLIGPDWEWYQIGCSNGARLLV